MITAEMMAKRRAELVGMVKNIDEESWHYFECAPAAVYTEFRKTRESILHMIDWCDRANVRLEIHAMCLSLIDKLSSKNSFYERCSRFFSRVALKANQKRIIYAAKQAGIEMLQA